MKKLFTDKEIRPIIRMALKEDLGSGDVTSNAIFTGRETSEALVTAREDGIFCGGMVVKWVYREIDPSARVTLLKKEGERVRAGEPVFRVRGRTKSLLAGERTALNFAQRMCGIATRTGLIAALLTGTKIRVLDTRKTAPGLRLLDKYAVRTGGGRNHRIGLFDMVLIKDNHIRAAGGITAAVARVKKALGRRFTIEVETTDLAEVWEAVAAKADIIMLDNMPREEMEKAVAIAAGRAKIEVSGNVDEQRIPDLRDLAVDYISVGALTHSVKAFDLSMKFTH